MPVSSNIHYNLSAWVSGSYTAGERVYTGSAGSGIVYQCTTAGTSTAAPTGTGTGINNGGTAVFAFVSTYDFLSLATWAASLPATLTQPYIALLWNNGPITTTPGTQWLVLSGHTTSSSSNITITCAPGESFTDALAADPSLPLEFNSVNGVSFVLPATGSNYTNYIAISDSNVVWDSIQMQDPNPTSASSGLTWSLNMTISNCIFDGYAQDASEIIWGGTSGTGTTTVIYNTIVVDREPTTDATGGTPVAVSLYNNLIFDSSLVIGVNAPTNSIAVINQCPDTGATSTFTNSMGFGYQNYYTFGSNQGATLTTTVSYCVFDCTELTGGGLVLGAGNQYSQASSGEFVNAATNFRLLNTASAVNAGTSSAAYGSSDILGTPRGSSWNIGPYQVPPVAAFGTASGTASVSGVAGALTRARGTAAGAANVGAVSGLQEGAGTANGKATVAGVGFTHVVSTATGTANGVASASAYNAFGSIDATITLNPITPTPLNSEFTVTGTYTIQPALEYVDDSGTAFTPIPLSGISPLGTQTFSFVHPGLGTPGNHQLVVVDLSTGTAGTATYTVNPSSTAPTAPPPSAFPPSGPTGLTKIIPSYLYQEYADDDNLQAMRSAYNASAQAYLDWFNQVNLPIYTGLSGPLLDWVAQGLYGMSRPTLSKASNLSVGPFNTYPLDTLVMAGGEGAGATELYIVTDELFKRMITWNFFKGDGFVFNTRWLKRRVMRFLGGTSGIDYGVSETYQVSVKFIGKNQINITINAGSQPTTYAAILAVAIGAGVCQLPFQYTYNVLTS